MCSPPSSKSLSLFGSRPDRTEEAVRLFCGLTASAADLFDSHCGDFPPNRVRLVLSLSGYHFSEKNQVLQELSKYFLLQSLLPKRR